MARAMIARRFFKLVLLLPLALFCPGCGAVNPRITVSCEHDENDSSAPHTPRTSTNKVGAAASFDLKPAEQP